MSLELGGHAPFVVLEDADLDEAVAGHHRRQVRDLGPGLPRRQPHLRALAAPRRLRRALRRRDGGAKVGPGLEPGVEIGPLMHARAVRKCEAHVADALAKGARLLAGGTRHALGGTFFAPTVLADVDRRDADRRGGDLRPRRRPAALRGRGGGRRPRQRHGLRPRRLRPRLRLAPRDARGRRARLRHGGDQHARSSPARRSRSAARSSRASAARAPGTAPTTTPSSSISASAASTEERSDP